MVTEPQKDTCLCGSGKRPAECKCAANRGQVIHFSPGRRHNYHICLADIAADLVDYARRYYYLWEAPARTKFTSFSQIHELDKNILPVFWHWFIANYRIHDDVSPIIDFYIAEKEEHLGGTEKLVLEALRQSYLSIYQVIWVKSNTIAIQDIFTHETYILERDHEKKLGIIDGGLLALRLIHIANTVLPVGKALLIKAEYKNRFIQEMNSFLNLEGVNDPLLILQGKAERLYGLVLDLAHGQVNRVLARNISLDSIDSKLLIKSLIKGSDFTFLERNEKWLKYTKKNDIRVFSRLYLGRSTLIAVSQDHQELARITQSIDSILIEGRDGASPVWKEGYYFDYPEEAEIFHLEIMHDMYLEYWLDKPLKELNGMSPLQAAADITGRVLLATMLEDLETLELIAQSKGEYFVPVSVIRTKLNLDKYRISRELLQPRAIAVQVEIYRSRQPLDSYVGKYQWASDEYRQVALAALDCFHQNKISVKQLAWILYMWNEFSSIYHPAFSKVRGWLAALEYAYYECSGSPCGYGAIIRKYAVSIWSLSIKAQLVVRHFKRYPLDFNQRIVKHPGWNNLNDEQKMQIYDELKQSLRIYRYSYFQTDEEPGKGYYENINKSGKYWGGRTAKRYEQFYQDHILLDNTDDNGSTIANRFWEDHARCFPSYLKTAAWAFMLSYVGAYRVSLMPNNHLLFEDLFSGQCHEVYGNFSHHVQDEVVPGMIVLTRLLPLDGKLWIKEPFYVVLPDLNELFNKNFNELMERLSCLDEGDYLYLKKRGELLLRAYFMALDEMEQNTMDSLKKPLHLRWLQAELGEEQPVRRLLERSSKFIALQSGQEITTWLWTYYVSRSNNQWGYIILTRSELLVFAPPGKDINRMLKSLRRLLHNVDMVVSFREYRTSLVELKKLESILINDLATYLNSFPEQAVSLLRQDMLDDEEKEYEQGLFLLKLGQLLMEHLEKMG